MVLTLSLLDVHSTCDVMKILVLNCGSSTLKFQLIETAAAVIFSGGIGENSPVIREKNLPKHGVVRPQARLLGQFSGKDGRISAGDSRLSAFVVRTDEELVIARETARLIAS